MVLNELGELLCNMVVGIKEGLEHHAHVVVVKGL